MQPTGAGGLSRFRSAPATWIEALLESEEEDVIIDPPKPSPPPPLPPQPSIAASYVDPNLFLPSPISRRQNSSPAEFLSQIINPDGYFPNFTVPAPSSYDDYLPSSLHAAKPSRNVNLKDQPVKFTTQLSGDQSALLDVEMDKLVEDTVPCRVRAKRGCATHPRSIAERVRRTRISDRIRKLQELVPNMDKQTNTADMLEEAVEYVKFLQTKIQKLREHQNKCTCSVKD